MRHFCVSRYRLKLRIPLRSAGADQAALMGRLGAGGPDYIPLAKCVHCDQPTSSMHQCSAVTQRRNFRSADEDLESLLLAGEDYKWAAISNLDVFFSRVYRWHPSPVHAHARAMHLSSSLNEARLLPSHACTILMHAAPACMMETLMMKKGGKTGS